MKRKAMTVRTTTLKIKLFLVSLSVLGISSSLNAVFASDPSFEVLLGERQLFLDDVGIAASENLKRSLHQPSKQGAVIRPVAPETSIQMRNAPQWDPDQEVYKLWYICSDGTKYGEMGYAQSKDGIHWTKIALNNVPLNPAIPSVRTPFNAVYDASDPDPSRRFKGLGHARGREPFVSANGIDWKRLDVPSIPSADESNLSLDEKENLFILTVKQGGPYGRSHAIWTSDDFEQWTNTNVVFHADALDQKLGRQIIADRLANPNLQQPIANDPSHYNVDVYNIGVFRYEGLYIGMPSMYYATGPSADGANTDGFHLVQLACSRDLQTWHRLADRQSFIGPSPTGGDDYDLFMIIGPSNAVVHGDELWFYYSGFRYRRRPQNARPENGAICLAVLRRDGFISLDADEKGGSLLTDSFKLTGTRLFVNVAANTGELHVEVLDAQGQVIATSAAYRGDQTRAEILWQKGNLATLKGQTLSLRFRLRNASLYSYWMN